MTISAGTRFGPYEIVEPIGAGGMGEVYRAKDPRLKREVAIKILPEQAESNVERQKRFLREAQAASALNHPNILVVFDIGNERGRNYIISELVRGESLRNVIQKGPVPVKKLLGLAVQIADGLASAHQAGIVHRDLKPDNIMVTDEGRVKILDFGLAKLTAEETGEQDAETLSHPLTQTGMIQGTVPYMSPEQASGSTVDFRSDQFSFGLILYEMASGKRAFQRNTPAQTLSAIISEEPEPISALSPKAPAPLHWLIARCMAKEPRQRYDSTADLLRSLRDILDYSSESNLSKSAELPAQQIQGAPSIAVLPFVNMTPDAENEYFCDGLAEELLHALTKIDELKVAARTSAFSFKGKNINVNEIGRALGVNTILEGSVRKAGDRVRITAQLINIADGYHLWSERYNREMKDIFDVQDEITLAVVEALKVKLLGDEQAAVLKRQTRSAEAHEFYLRGLSYFMRWTPEFFQRAIESFDQAIAIDPRYASAYAGLAEVYTEMSFFSFQRGYMPKARDAARKALELDDMLGEAHKALGVILMYYDRDYAGAEVEFKRAIALDPGSAHIHNWYGWYLGLMGRFDESLEEMKRARELDPLSDMINFGIGTVFHWSRQPARAIEQYRRVLELNPNLQIAYSFLAEAYVAQGDFVSAVATIENAPIALNDPVTLSAAAHAYARAGDRHKALGILRELEGRSSQDHELTFQIAQIYVGLGDNERSVEWLDKACDERSVWLVWLGVDPKFDPLRSDPRFADLMRRAGLPQ